ncbi:MAG: hypothetical protein JXL80_02510 [Planctomycetes bacterium]|nr:hypothetical protein [Planctomycetota bacterium]
MTGNGNRQPQDRVEGLLRQWGAEEAARQAAGDGLPSRVAAAVPGRRTGGMSLLVRWAPLAAAAALVIIAGGLFVATYGVRTDRASVPSLHAVETDVPRLMIRELESRLADTEAALQQSQKKLATATELLAEAKAARTATPLTMEGGAADSNLGKQRRQYDGPLGDDGRRLEETREQASQLAEVRGELEKIRHEFAAETSRLRSLYEETVAANGRLETELGTMKARQAAVLDHLRRGPLAAAAAQNWSYAPPVDGLWRGEAARDVGDLLQRGTALREKAVGEPVRLLFDRIEVVLTRLSLLDARDAAAGESFAALVRRSGLDEEIGKVLNAADQPADVQAWLLEVQLVLMGARHAG